MVTTDSTWKPRLALVSSRTRKASGGHGRAAVDLSGTYGHLAASVSSKVSHPHVSAFEMRRSAPPTTNSSECTPRRRASPCWS